MNILLVDDDDLLRECFGLLLVEEGFHVIQAASAEQALAAVKVDDAPVVLVTDLNLRSGMTGLDLVAAVRQRQPSTRAVVISGEYAVPGLHSSDRFLAKPFRMGELVKVIEAAAACMGI